MWVVEVVDQTGDVGQYSAIALDKDNIPHISYYDYHDATHGNLKYAVKTGSTWTIRTIDSAGNVGLYTSITVDQFKNPYISYYDQGNGYLKLAYFDGGWEINRCCSVDLDFGRSTSIKLDHMAVNPLILFFDSTDQNLKIAVFDRAGVLGPSIAPHKWGIEILRSSKNRDVSLFLDSRNQPRVSFSEMSANGESVFYGQKACLAAGCSTQVTPNQPTGQGTWSFEQVDSAQGSYTSLALERGQNIPHISYYDLAYGLRHAKKIGSAWSVENVDAGDVGQYSSMAVDSNNNPQISYYDDGNANLKYAGPFPPIPPRVDVWIKDCLDDEGIVPSAPAKCPRWWISPDISTDHAGFPGLRHVVQAHVRNRGNLPAQGTSVQFYYWDASIGARGNIRTVGRLIGATTLDVPTGAARVASVRWTHTYPPSNWCLAVVLDDPRDHRITPSVLPTRDNNFAVRCTAQNVAVRIFPVP
jgi:hypothetical protein